MIRSSKKCRWFSHLNEKLNDGTTNAAFYNNSSGSIVLNVVGGGDSPTVRNGTNASTTINNAVSLVFSNIVSGSEVRILSGTTELAGTQESSTTFEYTYNYIAGTFVDLVVLHLDYRYLKVSSIELPASDATIPIQLQIDRVYSNP